MEPGRSCLICVHDERDAIECDILAGKSLRTIGKAFGVAHETVRRHRDGCIPGLLARSRRAEAARRGDRLFQQADYLYAKAVAVLERAEEARDTALKLDDLSKSERQRVAALAEALAGSDQMVLRAIREARPTLELLAKLAGQIREEVTLNLVQAPDYQALRATILEAVRPHPEAHLALADAMNEFQVERGGDPQPLH